MVNGIDMNPALRYKIVPQEDEDDEEQYAEPKLCEYIFLIDRSGSMYNTITLANEALKLFLHSIPYGSYFNIVSYGSIHEMMFPKSVQYSEETFEIAIKKVSVF